MAFATRSALRLSRAANAVQVAASKLKSAAPRFFAAAHANRVSDTGHIKSVVGEKEIRATICDDGTGDGQTLRVLKSPFAPEPETVQPLSKDVYEQMPRTLKSMTVQGKVIIVTGGARGLGNHMARACAEAGAKAVLLFDANDQLGDEAAAALHDGSGLPVSFFRVDVRDAAAINAAVDAVVAMHGAPDVLVHAAGIADSNLKAETYDPALFRRLIDVNLTGSFLTAQSVGRAMMAAGKRGGSLILVASMSGSVVNYPQEQSCYNASKAGVVQFGRSIAAEWAKHGIRVNCISPGYMDTALNRVPALEAQKKIWTSLTPQNRLGSVDDLNGLCVFLASDSSGFMTGSNCIIDGGYSCY